MAPEIMRAAAADHASLATGHYDVPVTISMQANHTPFFWLGSPFRRSPGADIYGRPPTELPSPTGTCLGSADVTVP